MSHDLAALQQRADTAAESFCLRSGHLRREGAEKPSGTAGPMIHRRTCATLGCTRRGYLKIGGFYRQRDHAASPFFKILREHFEEFELVYPQRYTSGPIVDCGPELDYTFTSTLRHAHIRCFDWTHFD